MMNIYFEVYNPEQIEKEKELISKLESTPSFRDKLLSTNRRDFGELHINFYKHNFIIAEEMIWTLIFKVHTSAIETILNKGEIDKYQYTFEMVESDYIVFNLDGDTGLRIRHYGMKDYVDNNDEILYVSYDYLKQEIIVNKQEYIEKMLNCATRFISYRELINDSDSDFHLTYWKNKVIELKKLNDSLK